jgi:hypothetical protein
MPAMHPLPKGEETMPSQLTKGMIVMVYIDPITEEKQEGKARLVERQPDRNGDPEYGLEVWSVEFLDEPGHDYIRVIGLQSIEP